MKLKINVKTFRISFQHCTALLAYTFNSWFLLAHVLVNYMRSVAGTETVKFTIYIHLKNYLLAACRGGKGFRSFLNLYSNKDFDSYVTLSATRQKGSKCRKSNIVHCSTLHCKLKVKRRHTRALLFPTE
jgi:hypothetical protein